VAALAFVALTLAVIGLYALLSQLVVHRTREIGIRVALGARSEQVVALVVRHGVVLATVGVALGCALAVPTVRAMRSLLYDVAAFEPVTLVAVGGVMILIAAIASLLPARRAAAVDPAIALRSE
jgi:ABC-type antimicrobial peptide transport system permease subunit